MYDNNCQCTFWSSGSDANYIGGDTIGVATLLGALFRGGIGYALFNVLDPIFSARNARNIGKRLLVQSLGVRAG